MARGSRAGAHIAEPNGPVLCRAQPTSRAAMLQKFKLAISDPLSLPGPPFPGGTEAFRVTEILL